jgi:hypothetical protein
MLEDQSVQRIYLLVTETFFRNLSLWSRNLLLQKHRLAQRARA